MRTLAATLAVSAVLLMNAQEGGLRVGLVGFIEACPYEYSVSAMYPEREYSNSPRSGFGIQIQAELGKHLMVGSGVEMAWLSIRTEYNYRALYLFDPVVLKSTTRYTRSLRAPLVVGYRITQGRMEYIPSASFVVTSTGIPKTLVENENGSEYETTANYGMISSPQFMFGFDLAINRTVSERILVGVAPYVLRELDTLDSAIMKGPATLFGVRIGGYYRL